VKRLKLKYRRELDEEFAGRAAEGGVMRDRQVDLQQQEQGAGQALSLAKGELIGLAHQQGAQDSDISVKLRAATLG
jgi:hypothetical protein